MEICLQGLLRVSISQIKRSRNLISAPISQCIFPLAERIQPEQLRTTLSHSEVKVTTLTPNTKLIQVVKASRTKSAALSCVIATTSPAICSIGSEEATRRLSVSSKPLQLVSSTTLNKVMAYAASKCYILPVVTTNFN